MGFLEMLDDREEPVFRFRKESPEVG